MRKIRKTGNFPDKYTIGKQEWEFDCVSGTGEPIYKHKQRDGAIKFRILILENR